MQVNYRLFINQPCVLCDQPTGQASGLCVHCREDLRFLQYQCRSCGLPLRGAASLPCGRCQKKPPPLHHTWAMLEYDRLSKALIQALKFGKQLELASCLGMLMAKRAPATDAQAILPVPLHHHRLRQRGYNQAVELARPLARKLDLPLLSNAVARQRATPAQAELPAQQRRRNLRNAFVVRRPLPFQHLILLDDVMTTGSTLFELARTLKRAGVSRVDAWICARAP